MDKTKKARTEIKKDNQVMGKNLTDKSKWLALILRHQPEKAGITLDKNGWGSVLDLTDHGRGDIRLTELEEIIKTDNKGRYEFNHDKTMVRAVQGHSLQDVEIEMEECEPPTKLYHGTKIQFLSSIMKTGLRKMDRQHVHLSTDLKTAQIVADRRKGISVLLGIDSGIMYQDGIKFYLSKNNIYLTSCIPFKYIKIL